MYFASFGILFFSTVLEQGIRKGMPPGQLTVKPVHWISGLGRENDLSLVFPNTHLRPGLQPHFLPDVSRYNDPAFGGHGDRRFL
jgi:hypothetical protein